MSAVILLALAFSQQPTLEDLIRGLGDRDETIRDKAAASLVERGPEALAALEKARSDPDAEIAARAADAIVKIRAAVYRRRLSPLILEVLPDLPTTLAAGGEEDLFGVVFKCDPVYDRTLREMEARDRAAVVEIVAERWRADGKDWTRFIKKWIEALIWLSVPELQKADMAGESPSGSMAVLSGVEFAERAGTVPTLDAPLMVRMAAGLTEADRLAELLGSESEYVRKAALGGLLAVGRARHAEKVRALLDDKSKRVRMAAIEVAGELLDAAAVPRLMEIAKTGKKDAKLKALKALALIGAPDALDLFSQSLKDVDPEFTLDSLEALAEYDDERAHALLLECFDASDSGPLPQSAASIAQRLQIKGAPAKIHAWVARLDESKARRLRIGLARWEGEGAIPLLRPYLEEKDDALRFEAALVLADAGDREAIEIIAKPMSGQETEAARRLAERRDPRGGEMALRLLKENADPDSETNPNRRATMEGNLSVALWMIGKYRIPGAGETLAGALKKRIGNSEINNLIDAALKKVPDADDPLAAALKTDDADLQIRILDILAKRKVCKDPDRVAALAASPNLRLRLSAIAALPPNRIDKALLTSDIPRVRLAAAKAAGDRGVLKSLVDDPDRVVREDAALALASFGEKDVAPHLREMLNSTSTDIRREAVLALSRFGDAAAIPPLLAQLHDPFRAARACLHLSSYRSPRTFKRLMGLTLNVGKPLTYDTTWFQSALGLTVEGSPYCPLTLPLEPGVNGIDALLEFRPLRFPILEDDDRVRFVPRGVALRFWNEWFDARHK